MKNTMKKLMSLLLVAVLLVSAVPFQASAAGDVGVGFTINVKDKDGNPIGVPFHWQKEGGKGPDSKTVQQLLNYTGMDMSVYRFVSAVGHAANGDEVGTANLGDVFYSIVSGDVTIYLETIPTHTITIEYYAKDGSKIGDDASVSVKDGKALTFADVSAARPQADAYDLYSFRVDQQTFTNGGSWTPTAHTRIYATLVAKGGNTDGGNNGGNNGGNDNTSNTYNLNVVFYVNDRLAQSKTYNFEHKYVWELMKEGGYGDGKGAYTLQEAYLSTNPSVKKGLNDLIEHDQTVYIKMTTTNQTTSTITYRVQVDGLTYDRSMDVSQSTTLGALLANWNSNWANTYKNYTLFANITNRNVETTNTNTVVYGGDNLVITLTAKSGSTGDGSGNKFPYDVYLHVYLNNQIGEPHRNINITNTLAVDGVVSMSEVKNLIPDYYKAKTSNGINYDGLYLAKGNWVKDYVTDTNKYSKLTDVDVSQANETVHINVMITNANAKSSSTADNSNYKTGDSIFMVTTVMGLSATALACLFFYNKKRSLAK